MVESNSVEVRCSRCREVLESVAGIAVVEGAPILCYILVCALCAQAMDSSASICPECGRSCPEDERVQAGMKCGNCAYPGQNNETVDEAK